ncbi:Rieske 2Fe-2S domain-containing protein [Streptomyces sp. NBC_01233]|nr:Rieske 2Fe-2S domain-containing protein [Streptomyces sp. NBC_01233]
MGALLRRYWTPITRSVDVPEPDGPPVRARLFGEDFVVFRDTSGAVGVLDELCMHRGASLALGRVEGCGIRCLYHGWKFGADGTIMETPNQPDPRFRERWRAPAYPVREVGGLIWVYLGPPDKQPELPRYSCMVERPEGEPRRPPIRVGYRHNWLQGLEGVVDSSHVGILHQSEVQEAKDGDYASVRIIQDKFPTADDAPALEVRDTDFGFHYAAIRQAETAGDERYVRVTAFILPFTVSIPPGTSMLIWVPIDDYHTVQYAVDDGVPLDEETERSFLRWLGLDQNILDPDGFFIAPGQDRAAMAEGRSFSGYQGLITQDAVVTTSMGPMYDRSTEHVVPADAAVLRMRRLLIKAARTVAAGGAPIGLDRYVSTEKISGASGVVHANSDWKDLVPGHVELTGGRP